MADMAEVNRRLDDVEANLWWLTWHRTGNVPPPPPLGARSGLGTTTGLGGLIDRHIGHQAE